MRRIAFLLVALLAGAVFTGGVAQAAGSAETSAKKTAKHKKKPKAVKPKLRIVDSSASQLGRGLIKVQVRANKGAKVRLSSTTSTYDVAKAKLTNPVVARLGRKRAKVVTMRLTPASKASAKSCLPRKLTVVARNGKRQAKLTRSVFRDQPDCQLGTVDVSDAADCDFIAKPKDGMCMLPFPNDYYTVRDSSSPTGKRLHFTEGGMPQNEFHKPINPSTYDLSDGFSQGQGIVVKIPGIETVEAVQKNAFVPINHIGDYAKPNQKAVVINADTGERQPIWVNIDSNATTDQDRVLEIKPAVNFDEKAHYIVALRNLTDENGKPLRAPTAFRYYRDKIASKQSAVNARRGHYEQIFRDLKKAGIKRGDLYLAWDFTTASNENNYKRVLSMRDRAFAELGDTTMGDQIVQGDAPDYTIDSVQNFTPAQNPEVARKITGSFVVPCFLSPDCGSGSTMDLDANGLPVRHGDYVANMVCIVPRVALDDPNAPKTRPMIFGHGLFGDASGVDGGPNPPLAQKGMTICATDEIGMSGNDVASVMIKALPDLSYFNVLTDRLAQAIINELYLARLMYHPDGLGANPAFQDGDGTTPGDSVIKTDHVYYMGASQGGILGGPLTAVSPDFVQSSLLVGAMNYSILLPRSIDFDLYAALLYPSYPDEMSRPLLFGLMQILWDRSEPNGYAHVMTDNPPPNTPKHRVTLQIALGDHQVSNFASETMARTLGMSTNAVPVDPGRWPNYDILWNVPRLKASDYPYHGNNIIYFDGGPPRPNPSNPSQTIGTDVPPFANIPNRVAQDPHGAPGGASVAVALTSTFLQPNGYIDDVCSPNACYGDAWDGSL
ncbi:MAG: hypothetical protein J0H98_10775, partial [Solirubrobacterales bacterium]|nr:hypothetical protein [Solirubrobacterales bacterium]